MPSARVSTVALKRRKESAIVAKIPKVVYRVSGGKVKALLDSAAEVNVITSGMADDLSLLV